MKAQLKEINRLAAVERRTEDDTKKEAIEDKIEIVVKQILKELGREQGFGINESGLAESLFIDNNLTSHYAFYLGNGEWS